MKKTEGVLKAYRLGDYHPALEKLINSHKIIDMYDGTYEVFSMEALKGGSGHGQIAFAEDWVRIDCAGYPYINKNLWFKENFRHIKGDEYKQIPIQLNAWTANLEICEEVQFLIHEKGLVLDEHNPDNYFQAFLWGTMEKAPRDAVLMFYNISYDNNGTICDVDFNFVDRAVFDYTYSFIQE